MPSTPGLGVHAEWVVAHLESTLEHQSEFSVLRTPASPSYYFGNALALHGRLESRDKTDWEAEFSAAFPDQRLTHHRTFIWTPTFSAPEAECRQTFENAGYKLNETHVLILPPGQAVTHMEVERGIEIRPLSDSNHWHQWLEMELAGRESGHAEEDYRAYLKTRERNYRALEMAGHGQFFGAFAGELLVGAAGIFHYQRLARFQYVRVIDDWQGRGIAKALLAHLSNWVQPHADTQIILADAHYHATTLYQNLGFRVTEHESSLCWWPRDE